MANIEFHPPIFAITQIQQNGNYITETAYIYYTIRNKATNQVVYSLFQAGQARTNSATPNNHPHTAYDPQLPESFITLPTGLYEIEIHNLALTRLVLQFNIMRHDAFDSNNPNAAVVKASINGGKRVFLDWQVEEYNPQGTQWYHMMATFMFINDLGQDSQYTATAPNNTAGYYSQQISSVSVMNGDLVWTNPESFGPVATIPNVQSFTNTFLGQQISNPFYIAGSYVTIESPIRVQVQTNTTRALPTPTITNIGGCNITMLEVAQNPTGGVVTNNGTSIVTLPELAWPNISLSFNASGVAVGNYTFRLRALSQNCGDSNEVEYQIEVISGEVVELGDGYVIDLRNSFTPYYNGPINTILERNRFRIGLIISSFHSVTRYQNYGEVIAGSGKIGWHNIGMGYSTLAFCGLSEELKFDGAMENSMVGRYSQGHRMAVELFKGSQWVMQPQSLVTIKVKKISTASDLRMELKTTLTSMQIDTILDDNDEHVFNVQIGSGTSYGSIFLAFSQGNDPYDANNLVSLNFTVTAYYAPESPPTFILNNLAYRLGVINFTDCETPDDFEFGLCEIATQSQTAWFGQLKSGAEFESTGAEYYVHVRRKSTQEWIGSWKYPDNTN